MEKTNKDMLIEAVKLVPSIASDERWVLTLDRDEGALFYSPEVIPDGAELHQVTDEYSMYVDKDFRPRGVMVEYYDHNFIQHHPEFKIMSPKVFGAGAVVESKKDGKNEDAMVFKALFEKDLDCRGGFGAYPDRHALGDEVASDHMPQPPSPNG